MTDDEIRSIVADKLAALSPHHADSISFEVSSMGIHLELCSGTIKFDMRRGVALNIFEALATDLANNTPETDLVDQHLADMDIENDRGN